jgi:hypothetical protein
MDVFVVGVVRGGDLGQKASDHLDDLRDRHGANLILSRPGWRMRTRTHEVFAGEALDVG